MRKKLLTVALAATMAVSSVFSAFAETSSSLDNTAGWSNPGNAGYEQLTGDFNVTYSFKIDKVGKDNWNNFVIELRTGEEGSYNYLDIRADAFAFTNGNDFGATFAEGGSTSKLKLENDAWVVPEGHDWAAWLAACPGATVEANLVRTGDTFKYTAKFSTGATFSAGFSIDGVDVADVVDLTFFGDGASFSNIKFTNNASAPATPDPTPAPSDDKKDETTTAAPAGSKDNVTPSKTGDTAAVAVVAIVALGAAVAVVASKKKVTE